MDNKIVAPLKSDPMETQDTLAHTADEPVLRDGDHSTKVHLNHPISTCPAGGPVLYDNNHLNKIPLSQLSHTYRKDEAVVYLDPRVKPDLDMCEKISAVKKTFCQKGVPYDSIKVRKCGSCDMNLPLFLIQGPNVHTVIVSQGVPGGTSPQPQTVGESYSLNFLSQIPHQNWDRAKTTKPKITLEQKKEVVTVAVLDTGLDDSLVDPAYICDDFAPKEYMPCFNNIKKGGWNFVPGGDPSNYMDDNKGRHGSLVSQYIINGFKDSSKGVKIMPLKTHDANGGGDLFSIICAIHFAMAKGADIINASWGFYYYYQENFLEYFRNLIENELQKKGILFVTAAGNRIPEEDILANRIYYSQNHSALSNSELRDLSKHKFFPAHLSTKNKNIITVTTTNVEATDVSDQQNHSNIYVDLGVAAHTDNPPVDGSASELGPGFKVPFELNLGAPPAYVAGSSFATAIATGRIGATASKGLYQPGLVKEKFINGLPIKNVNEGPGTRRLNRPGNLNSLIRNGVVI